MTRYIAIWHTMGWENTFNTKDDACAWMEYVFRMWANDRKLEYTNENRQEFKKEFTFKTEA